MKTKFKAGDRIAVYGFNRSLHRARVVCNITEVLTDGSGALYTDQNYTKESPFDATIVVPEQCRKIKKPKPKTLRIHKDVWEYWKKKSVVSGHETSPDSEYIDFVEIKKNGKE